VTGLLHVEDVMGTSVTLDLRWRDGAQPARVEDAVVAAVGLLHEVDRIFSTWRSDSAVSRLRRGEIGLGDCPAVVREVVVLCATARRISRGWFDPWKQPGGFDPTGLVKGWAAREVGGLLTAYGVEHHNVNAGGDLCVRGSADGCPEGRGWTVGLTDPHDPQTLLGAVTVRDAAVATSGGYERGSLAVDPFTRTAVDRLAAVTVAGPDLALADALATAATAAGDESLGWLEAAEGYEALLVLPGGALSSTSGWAAEVPSHRPGRRHVGSPASVTSPTAPGGST
jgi:thiamine biosynthesis lipoprotein